MLMKPMAKATGGCAASYWTNTAAHALLCGCTSDAYCADCDTEDSDVLEWHGSAWLCTRCVGRREDRAAERLAATAEGQCHRCGSPEGCSPVSEDDGEWLCDECRDEMVIEGAYQPGEREGHVDHEVAS